MLSSFQFDSSVRTIKFNPENSLEFTFLQYLAEQSKKGTQIKIVNTTPIEFNSDIEVSDVKRAEFTIEMGVK